MMPTSMLYRHVLKPILFAFDPEKVHDFFTNVGKILGSHRLGQSLVAHFCAFEHPMLTQDILGLQFKNPIGLSAGFDKNAELTDILPSVGFGFAEVGSVTGEPCAGNPKPRLWRLPKSQGLLVHYGLKNDGCERIAQRLSTKKHAFPIGISIAKTNNATNVETATGIADYTKAMQTLEPYADYLTINISCPNAFGGEPFTDPERLNLLLTTLDNIPTQKSLFVKLPVDISTQEIDTLLKILTKHNVQGVIISNLTKKHTRPEINPQEIQGLTKGGVSGKPTEEASNALIAHVYRTMGTRFIIIGSGGIFTAEDAYEKLQHGASLLQLITGMIFEGPQVIKKINKGLVVLLEKDGYHHISEAIGKKNAS